jgi:hypothetical protein
MRRSRNSPQKIMTTRKAVYGVGGALLFAYLAAANMPTSEPASRARTARPAGTSGTQTLAEDVRTQALVLHARMAQAPVPAQNTRNPFSFAPRMRTPPAGPAGLGMVHAAVAPDAVAAPVVPPLPILTLMGVAEETTAAGPRRTAVIALRHASADPDPNRVAGGDADTLYMVVEGQAVGDRYKVTKIGVDAVELEDLQTHGYRRIAMRP